LTDSNSWNIDILADFAIVSGTKYHCWTDA